MTVATAATDDLVREFHEATGQEAANYPTPPDTALARFRGRLITEEFKEVMEVLERLAAHQEMSPDDKMALLAKLLGELCDLRYVIEGTAVSLGLPMERAYRDIHAANMRKRWPDGTFHTNDYGKVIKPPGWKGADMTDHVPPILDVTYSEVSR
jgi:predicted HAD superfamily Cof-like phosphohydrolase